MASIKELNALLLRHGLFPEKQALVLLRDHVEGAADVKAEVAAVIHRVKASADSAYPSLPARRSCSRDSMRSAVRTSTGRDRRSADAVPMTPCARLCFRAGR